LREFLSAAFACVGIEDWSGYVVSDQSLLRPAEVLGLVGNAAKARDVLGWEPTVPFEEIVFRMVRHDLETPSDISRSMARP
jgi:GDPmannose 4,6-dehydratase